MVLPRAALQALLVLDRRGVCFQRTWVLYELMQVRERKEEKGTDLLLRQGLNRGAGVHPSRSTQRAEAGDGRWYCASNSNLSEGRLVGHILVGSPCAVQQSGGGNALAWGQGRVDEGRQNCIKGLVFTWSALQDPLLPLLTLTLAPPPVPALQICQIDNRDTVNQSGISGERLLVLPASWAWDDLYHSYITIDVAKSGCGNEKQRLALLNELQKADPTKVTADIKVLEVWGEGVGCWWGW